MINLHKSVTGLGLDLTTPGSAVRRAGDCASDPGLCLSDGERYVIVLLCNNDFVAILSHRTEVTRTLPISQSVPSYPVPVQSQE